MKKTCLITLLAILTGCSAVKVPEKNKFVLDQPARELLQKSSKRASIQVSAVTAAPVYQSKDMIYVDKNYQVKAFAYNEWAAPPAKMLVPLVVESLRNSGVFHAVVPPMTPGKVDYRLTVDILSLQQQFTTNPSQVEVMLSAQIFNDTTRKVVATRRIVVREKSPSKDPYGGVLAANRAMRQALRELTAFCRLAVA